MSAFAHGIDKLAAGNPAAAERFFRLSQAENPVFAEAQLLLAESLLRQGRTSQAQRLALQLIESQRDGSDAYTVVAAMELVSRVAQHDGHSDIALKWALDASEQAASEGLYCVARDLNERLRGLLAVVGEEAAGVGVRVAGVADEVVAAECEERRRALETGDNIRPVPKAMPARQTPAGGYDRAAAVV